MCAHLTKYSETEGLDTNIDNSFVTHIALSVLVGSALQQQPNTIRVTSVSGENQRRAPVLCLV
jgi:hypothetical protein